MFEVNKKEQSYRKHNVKNQHKQDEIDTSGRPLYKWSPSLNISAVSSLKLSVFVQGLPVAPDLW